MSQIYSPGAGGSGGSGITTIDGDTGSITGSTVTIFANNATNNSGSSVKFVNSGTVSTFDVTDANNNTMIGKNSGTLGITGIWNVGLGAQTLNSLVGGNDQIAIGFNTLSASVNDNDNIGIGYQSLAILNGGNQNLGIGTNLYLSKS